MKLVNSLLVHDVSIASYRQLL